MKKTYMKPAMCTVRVWHQRIICTSTEIRGVTTNMSDDADIDYGGGGNGPARVRQQSGIVWDD